MGLCVVCGFGCGSGDKSSDETICTIGDDALSPFLEVNASSERWNVSLLLCPNSAKPTLVTWLILPVAYACLKD